MTSRTRQQLSGYLGQVDFKPSGHPVLSQVQLIRIAEAILVDFDRSCVTEPGIVSMPRMIEWLKGEYGAKIEFADLRAEAGEDSSRILGVTLLQSKTMLLDIVLLDDEHEHLRQFTVAHEIGHLVLHTSREIKVDPDAEPIKRVRDSRQHFSVTKADETVRSWMEFQANRFAAMLIMPPPAFCKSLLSAQKELGVTRKGEVWEHQANVDVVSATLKKIAGTFGTSPTAVKHHLESLGLLRSQIPKRRSAGLFAFPE